MTSPMQGSPTRRARGPAPAPKRTSTPKRPAASRPARTATAAAKPAKRTLAGRLKTPLVAAGAAAAGVVGGLVLGGRVLSPGKRVLGVEVARKRVDLGPVAREI